MMTSLLLKLFVKNSDDTGNPKVRTAYGVLSGIVGIICNALLCAGKLAVGFFSGSVSVIADAVNNLSDASSSVVTLIGFRLAAKPADEKHPFGHYRIEYFSGLAVAVMIVVIGVELIKSSIEKIINTEEVEFSVDLAAVLFYACQRLDGFVQPQTRQKDRFTRLACDSCGQQKRCHNDRRRTRLVHRRKSDRSADRRLYGSHCRAVHYMVGYKYRPRHNKSAPRRSAR